MNIYQEIWDADQQGSGIRPVLREEEGDELTGFIVVNEKYTQDPNQKLFTRVVIPEHKMHTYNLCKKLFNNYSLSQGKPEIQTPEEDEEIHNLLEAIVDTKPMKAARQWLELQTGEEYNVSRWYKLLLDIWFTRFTQSSGIDLSAFEHVVVGEQDGSTVSGYHFWYKYHLDDSGELLNRDDILYLGTKGEKQDQNLLVPEVSTITFKWEAYDYEAEARRPLYKKIGGFFNGCSIEGLLALGAIRFIGAGRAPKETAINGAMYNLRLYRSSNGKHMRTFYPEFLRLVDPSEITQPVPGEPPVPVPTPETPKEKSVRIIAALVNPPGDDVGLENVSLINVTPSSLDLSGWQIEDRNQKTFTIRGKVIEPGAVLMVSLPGDSAQLSNQGGIIKLKDGQGVVIDSVSYSREQARQQGWTIVF